MSKSNVNPNHYKVAGRERQGEDIAQIRNKQMLAESLVRSRYEPDARFQKPAPVQTASAPAAPTDGPGKKTTKPTREATAKRATTKSGAPKRATSKRATTKPVRKRANVKKANKRGNASTTQKRTRR